MEIEGYYVLRDGSSDPTDPAPARIQVHIDPDGSVRYVGDAAIYGAGYLAFSLEAMWPATLAANFVILQENLTETWANEGFSPLPAVPDVTRTPTPTPTPTVVPEEPALTLTLEIASGPLPAEVAAPQGEAKRLPEHAAVELLSTVPKLAVTAGARSANLPIARRDPPPVGGLEVQAFEPKPDKAPILSGQRPLRVDRFTPSGPVDWVPRIHIVFSKTMVPLSSHAALAKHIPEVSLLPPIDGEWQWQDTQTLLFQLSEPPVGSTRYEVKVAPGSSRWTTHPWRVALRAHLKPPG